MTEFIPELRHADPARDAIARDHGRPRPVPPGIGGAQPAPRGTYPLLRERPQQPDSVNHSVQSGSTVIEAAVTADRQLTLDVGNPSVDAIVGADLRTAVMETLVGAGFLARFWQKGAAFVRAAPTLAAGCVLIDLRQPDGTGRETHDEIRRAGLFWPVVAIVAHGDVHAAVIALKGGIEGVVEAPVDGAELNRTIADAMMASPTLNSADDMRRAAHCLSKLTRREKDVLRGLVAGLPNKTIAYDLGISPRTVEVYRANIMQKCSARSLSDVLRVAFSSRFA